MAIAEYNLLLEFYKVVEQDNVNTNEILCCFPTKLIHTLLDRGEPIYIGGEYLIVIIQFVIANGHSETQSCHLQMRLEKIF
jgi:hypothetical protein